ncbi:MAG: hypothetical protein U0X91_27485 [Spirosomataceae bacterium]
MNDHRLTSHHVSLYFVFLVRAWEEGQTFPIERKVIMEQAKIRSRSTYTRCLYQLQEWEYLRYKPAPNQFQPSEITGSMPINGHSNPTAGQQNERSKADALSINESGTDFAMPITEHSALNAMVNNEPSSFAAVPKIEPNNGLKGADTQVSHLAEPKNGQSKFVPPPSPSSSAWKKSNTISFNKNDVVGAGGDVLPRSQLKNRPGDHPFTQSPYFEWAAFQAALAESNQYRNADLRYYYDALCDWRDRESGLPPLRSDWLRTARVFMRNDAKNHKLVLVTQPQPPQLPSHGYQPPIINNDKYRRSE